MLRFGDLWQKRLVKASLFAKPVIDDGRIVWGRSTILFKPCASPPTGASPRDERLSVLLAVAGVSQPFDGLALLFKTVGAEWQRSERAIAAIRLAFALIPPLDEKGAYRLFLAEEALEAGLDPALLLREFGIDDSIAILKYNRDQPRVPKGNGRESGQFGSATQAGQPDVSVAFLAPSVADRLKDTDAPSPLQIGPPPRRFADPDLNLDPAPLPLPIPIPFPIPDPKTDDEDGPACPAMRPDRSPLGNPAGDAEEARVARMINPYDPTPKRGPGQPLSVAMAYYLATLGGSGEVEYDDCKRTTMPALIPEMKKGDMAETKTKTSAWLIWQDFAQGKDGAGPKFDSQIKRQLEGVRLENKGREIYYCVGSQENVEHLTKRYGYEDYHAAHFLVCQ